MILASQSYEQCRAVFAEYGQIAKHDIEHAISKEMSGDVAKGMITIGRHILLLKMLFKYGPLKMYLLYWDLKWDFPIKAVVNWGGLQLVYINL